ncbi:phage tail protein I [Maritalea porphyrae]|uniref:phage tail protein I n=1 Tax=Maritalea porphyrae TaxID=880732 RepID=UPI0022AFD032|nr:phage tail protein I [Maritalea porphyrae]MCZ4273293.1 phage tail protein I [Maritalea porphyrae]
MPDLRFEDRLIPPGIFDGRTQALFAMFANVLSDVDIQTAMERQPSEEPIEVLPLVMAEKSIGEFIDVEGSPEPAIRTLIENAFPLHEAKGTDPGVLSALDAFGLKAEIEQWYDQTPVGSPHTHNILINTDQDIFGEGELWSIRAVRQSKAVIETMKRKSQTSEFRLGVEITGPTFVAVAAQVHHEFLILPEAV